MPRVCHKVFFYEQDVMEFIYNHFYVISIEHPYLRHLPQELVQEYTKNIVVQFKGWYYTDKSQQNRSIILHHNVKDFCISVMLLSHICRNHVIDDNDICYWESHIFRKSFIVNRDITHIIKRACLKFKQLLKKTSKVKISS